MLLFGSIFGGVGLILLTVGIYFYNDTNAYQKDTIRVKGKVIRLSASYAQKGGRLYTPIVEFEFNNQTFQVAGSVASSPSAFDVGEEVELFVKPAQPQEARIDSFMEQWFVVVILGGMGAVFSTIGLAVIRSALKS